MHNNHASTLKRDLHGGTWYLLDSIAHRPVPLTAPMMQSLRGARIAVIKGGDSIPLSLTTETNPLWFGDDAVPFDLHTHATSLIIDDLDFEADTPVPPAPPPSVSLRNAPTPQPTPVDQMAPASLVPQAGHTYAQLCLPTRGKRHIRPAHSRPPKLATLSNTSAL